MSRVRVTGRGIKPDDMKDMAKKMLLDLHADIVLNTPVDTGRLRSSITVDTDALKIESNVEYANVVLETGHSRQAPAGMLSSLIDKHTRI